MSQTKDLSLKAVRPVSKGDCVGVKKEVSKVGMPQNLTVAELRALRFFRGTGQFVGRDARHKSKWPKKGMTNPELLTLRRKGFLEHFAANQWYLTDAGREIVHGPALPVTQEEPR